jgi:transcriptional regulator with XRE-family HTH domain
LLICCYIILRLARKAIVTETNVGKNVSDARRLRMWTQGELARAAGISPTTISGIESGRISNPHFGTIRKLARALDLPPEELMVRGSGDVRERDETMSLEWARSAREEEFEKNVENATLESLDSLSRALDEEQTRLRALYGEFPSGSEQRRLVKRQIREVSAKSGSVSASIEFHEDAVEQDLDDTQRG